MKLTYREIEPFLTARPKSPVVLIYGPDHGLVKERCARLARYVVPNLDDPFNVAILPAAALIADPAKLHDEAAAVSMLGGDRVVIIQEASDGLTAALKSYLAAPVRETLVLIEGGDLPLKSSLRKLIEGDKNAHTLPCYVQDAGDVTRQIVQAVRAAGLTIDPDAAAIMATAIAGDAKQVRSEIEKLLTYMGVDQTGQANQPRTITDADVNACVGSLGGAAIDGLIDALLAGDTARTLDLYHRLMAEEPAPIMILRSLLAHGRKIATTHERLRHGEQLDDILDPKKNPPVFFKRKAAFAAQLRNYPPAKLHRLMHDVWSAEVKIKSGDDHPAALPQMLLGLSARARKAG